jgi:glycosyltransferase involved in cell wall biosynthesis
VRILYFTDVRFPIERANGVQAMATAQALACRGHEVRLVVRPDVFQPARDPFAFYEWPAEPRLAIEYARIAGPFWLRRLEYLGAAVARAARARRADLLFTRDLGVARLLLRVPGRPPLVYESHGYAPVFAETLDELVSGASRAPASKGRRLVAREAAVWRGAEGYVSTTHVLAHELTVRFGARSHVSVIPNGVRLPPAPPPPPAGPPTVVYAGHLYPWKGADVLVQALARLPGVHATVLGGRMGDPDLARVTALATGLGVSSRVTFTGFVPASGVTAALAAATVAVVPTLDTASARYTSPLKMFEYMAARRPIVASDLPPVREILTDRVNARLVPPGDPVALAAAVADLVADPDGAARLVDRAAADVAAYTWERRAVRLDALFTGVCSR